MPRSLARLFACCILAVLTACGGSSIRGDGPGSGRIPELPGDAVPRNEPKSRYGNGPVYEVLGKRYTVMPSATNYQARGVASWYGKKFHGRLTSNREVYDMYAMTAAHTTLPLPTYVRVRNLRNNKSVVVRVNDRGPFLHNRIIDLSYAAALKLDMVRDGTSLVEVTAINVGEPQGNSTTSVSTPAVRQDSPEPPAAAGPVATSNQIFVQVGAFGDRANANRRMTFLTASGIESAFVHEDTSSGAALYRVRIGPVADVVQYDMLVEELENIGILDPYLITE